MKKFALLFLAFVLGVCYAIAQTREITGTVTSSEDGSSIPGVSVSVKKSTLGTITDMDGKYVLKIPKNAETLVFSFVGMETNEIPIEGKTVINATLSSANISVDEVVVTALGISREKKALGYAVQEVSGDDLAKTKSDNFVNSLSGKVSGIQVTSASGALGASSRITIRGNSSFTSNEPLFVVDGIPISNYQSKVDQYNTYGNGVDFGNGASDIDPSNIESITVLKGANAAALYGMEAANGVILITTKSGSKSEGFKVNLNSGITFSDSYIIPHYQNDYGQGHDGSEYIYNNSGSQLSYQDYASTNSFTYVDGKGGGVYDNKDESWGPKLNAGLKLAQFDSPVVDGVYQPTDWVSHPDNVKDFFKTGISYDNNISIEGASDNMSGRLYLSSQEMNGTIPNTDLKINTASVNTNLTSPMKRLSVKGTITYTQSKSDNLSGEGYDENNVMQSIGSWFGRQVNMKSLKANWKTYNQDGNPYNWNSNYHNNPYWTVYKNTNSMQKDRVTGHLNATYKLADWISVMGRVGMDWYHLYRKRVSSDGSVTISDGGTFWQSQDYSSALNADLIFTFDKDISETVGFNGTLGANYQDHKRHYMYYGASSLTVPDLFSITNVSGTPEVDQDDTRYKSNSVFGSASFDYKKWLFLDLTGRNDWSSTLPRNSWSFFYPSITGSFLATDAFPSLKSNTFSFLKLRASWAQVGNATDPFQLQQTYTALTSYNGTTPFHLPTTLPPSGLKPEKINSTEFGIETKFLNNRIGVDATYYDKVTKNQIMDVDISDASGYDKMKINAGEIENKGIELQLSAVLLKSKKGLNWEATLNWSKNYNKVNNLYGDLSTYQISDSWGSLTIEAEVGKKFGVIKGYAPKRNDDGAVIVSSSGLPLQTDNTVEIGNIMPDWVGGLNNSFSWKNFTASFLLDMRWGGDVFSVTQWFGAQAGTIGFTSRPASREGTNGANIREVGMVIGKDVLSKHGAVYEDGSENTTVVSAQEYYNTHWWDIEQYGIIKGSYLKLREVTFGYTIPRSLLKKTNFIKAASISFVGHNVALLWTDSSNMAHIDPETAMGSSLAGMGIEQYQIPATRNLGFKVSLTF